MGEEKQRQEINGQSKGVIQEAKACMYWSARKRNQQGKYYCTWDGEYYWTKDCRGCKNFQTKK